MTERKSKSVGYESGLPGWEWQMTKNNGVISDSSLNNFQEMEDAESELIGHFLSHNRWDDIEITQEARRVYSQMFCVDIEEGSAMDGLFFAIAIAAKKGAYASVAAALGVDRIALESAAAQWYEEQDAPPPPCSPESFMALIDAAKAEA